MSGQPGGARFSPHNIRSGQDLLCGLLYVIFGAFLLFVGRDYPMGTPVRLGTGVFPSILCWGMIITGVVVFVKALVTDGPRLPEWHWQPVVLVTLGVVAFSLLIDSAGLLVSMIVLMVLGALAGQDHRWKQTAVFMVIMLIIGWALFIEALGMPIKVTPWS